MIIFLSLGLQTLYNPCDSDFDSYNNCWHFFNFKRNFMINKNKINQFKSVVTKQLSEFYWLLNWCCIIYKICIVCPIENSCRKSVSWYKGYYMQIKTNRNWISWATLGLSCLVLSTTTVNCHGNQSMMAWWCHVCFSRILCRHLLFSHFNECFLPIWTHFD